MRWQKNICARCQVFGGARGGRRDTAHLGERCNECAYDDDTAECRLGQSVAGNTEKHDGGPVQLIHDDDCVAELQRPAHRARQQARRNSAVKRGLTIVLQPMRRIDTNR